MNVGAILLKLWSNSGFAAIITGFLSNNGWQNLVMLAIACVLLYLAIVKKFEPLLRLPLLLPPPPLPRLPAPVNPSTPPCPATF